MAEITLRSGEVALVDDDDFANLSRFAWYAIRAPRKGAKPYAQTKLNNASVYMHRLIMGPPTGKDVDHRNGNGLDNRKANLRVCTRAENCRNLRNIRPHSSRFKGVSLDSRDGRWMASIKKDKRNKFLGYFEVEVDAAKAYNEAAKAIYGDFANLNDIPAVGA